MIEIINLLSAFTLAVFLLLNGPLWLSTRFHLFAGGPEPPRWLTLTTASTSRVVGATAVLFWLTTVGQGNILYTVLLGVSHIGAVLLLLNSPLRLVTSTTFFCSRFRSASRISSRLYLVL